MRGRSHTVREVEQKVTRPALKLAIRDYYKTRYMRRFGPENAAYTSRRNRKYEDKKFRKFGHRLRLVYEGERDRDSLLRRMRASVTIGTSKPRGQATPIIRGTMKFPGARKINQFRKASRDKIQRELRTHKKKDINFITKSFQRQARGLVRALNAQTPLKKTL
jgi:hypothetical protein